MIGVVTVASVMAATAARLVLAISSVGPVGSCPTSVEPVLGTVVAGMGAVVAGNGTVGSVVLGLQGERVETQTRCTKSTCREVFSDDQCCVYHVLCTHGSRPCSD